MLLVACAWDQAHSGRARVGKEVQAQHVVAAAPAPPPLDANCTTPVTTAPISPRTIAPIVTKCDRQYYPSGQIKWQADYIDGQLSGVVRHWYDNGQLWQEARFERGAITGSYVAYYPTGRRFRQATLDKGMYSGPVVEWWPSGRPRSIGSFLGQFDDPVREGIWAFWNENGRIDAHQSGRYSQGWKSCDLTEEQIEWFILEYQQHGH